MTQDTIVWLSGEDPDMARAIKAAQATFSEFARQVELENFRIVPAFTEIAVKAFFPDPNSPTQGEHMFVSDVSTDGVAITGILDSEPANPGLGIEEGENVKFLISRLSDWFLVERGKGLGGFTIDVLKRQMTPSQLKEYQAHPPLSWYRDRVTMDAITEIESVPVCRKCEARDLTEVIRQRSRSRSASGYREGVCGLCLEGAVRCACPTCGAPLIRYPNAPPECHRCLSNKSGQ
ncbi:MAG TPA: DUF2314 domain-containing protein [Gemmataceae bacterium]|nr:DUF2314 domain-containing protein [Gemmataceae bacterium]